MTKRQGVGGVIHRCMGCDRPTILLYCNECVTLPDRPGQDDYANISRADRRRNNAAMFGGKDDPATSRMRRTHG